MNSRLAPKLKWSVGALIGALALLLISLIGWDDRLRGEAALTDAAAPLDIAPTDRGDYRFGRDRSLLAAAPVASNESSATDASVLDFFERETTLVPDIDGNRPLPTTTFEPSSADAAGTGARARSRTR